MSEILGAIASHDGVVIISNNEDDVVQGTVFKINQNSVATVVRGKVEVKEFLDKYIIPKTPKTVLDVIDLIQKEIQIHSAEYAKSNISFIITGYENSKVTYFTIWFENENLQLHKIGKVFYFITGIEDLATYIISKVFSEQMSIDELKNLMGFVTLQCIKVFDSSSSVNITTISKDGVKEMSKGEVKDLLSTQDKIDHKLKKIFSDFFVNGASDK